MSDITIAIADLSSTVAATRKAVRAHRERVVQACGCAGVVVTFLCAGVVSAHSSATPSSQSAQGAASLGAEPLFRSSAEPALQSPAPADQPTRQAAARQCGNVLLTHSFDHSILPGGSVSCNTGGPEFLHNDNGYFRSFDLADFGLDPFFVVCSVEFGIETATSLGGSQPVEVRIYDTPVEALGPPVAEMLVPIPDQALSYVDVPMVADITTGILTVEIFTPNGIPVGNSFFLGANNAGQSGPSYIMAPDCGAVVPTDVAMFGFPDVHYVVSVNGDGIFGHPACNPGAEDCCLEHPSPGCNVEDCCIAVCTQAPHCCDVVWDAQCVLQAEMLCGQLCGEVCGLGNGDCCSANGTPGCDDPLCCENVCLADPFCCDPAWDQGCADQAHDVALCGELCEPNVCGPGNGDCCAANGTPGCDDPACCQTVCALDPICCDVEWHDACAALAQDFCGPLCLEDCGACDSGGICDLQVGLSDGFLQECMDGQWRSLAFPFNTGGAIIDTVSMVHNTNTGEGDLYVMGGTCEGPDINQILAVRCNVIANQPSGVEVQYCLGTAIPTSSTEPTWVVAVWRDSFSFDVAYNAATCGTPGAAFGNLDGLPDPAAWQDMNNFPDDMGCTFGACYCTDVLLTGCQLCSGDGDCDDGYACTLNVCDPDDPIADFNGCVTLLAEGATCSQDMDCYFLGGEACIECQCAPPPACQPSDLDDDGQTNASDLALLLGSWGPCPPPPDLCPEDINDDAFVNAADLALILGDWGLCAGVCLTHGDCLPGEVCVQSVCEVGECATCFDCLPGFVCHDNVCQTPEECGCGGGGC